MYKPGNVKLRPEVPGRSRTSSARSTASPEPFDLVFHGGSGSLLSEIREALDYGVVKMNVDTDTQYAFTRPVVGHMMTEYDGVLKIDGEVRNKKMYDPRAWGQEGRGRNGCTRRGGVHRPAFGRHQDEIAVNSSHAEEGAVPGGAVPAAPVVVGILSVVLQEVCGHRR